MNNLNINIGKRIRDIRKSKDISIEKMAESLKVSYSTYQRIEAGETDSWVVYLEPISSILNVDVDDIVLAREKIEQNNTNQKGGVAIAQNSGTINYLSEKLIEQYEIRLKEKDEIINKLKENIGKNKE